MEVQVDTGSSINFLTREMATDHGLEIHSLGSKPFLCQTVTGEVIFNEYVNLTLVSEVFETGEARQHVETAFFVLPSDIPSNAPSFTKPIIGHQLAQKNVHLLQDTKTLGLTWPTRTSTEDVGLLIRSRSH